MKNLSFSKNNGLMMLFSIPFFLFVAFYISMRNYFLFHTSIEIVTIVVGFSAMIASIKTLNMSNNNYFHFLGITSGFTMIIIFAHVITYKGAAILTNDPNIPTQLYILYKYFDCIFLIVSFYFMSNKINIKRLSTLSLAFIIPFLWIILFSNLFPKCYNEGIGLTRFKIISEYLFCLCYIVILFFLKLKKTIISKDKINLIALSVIFKLVSSIFFSFYIDVYDISNFIGHISNFISYCLFYSALFKGVMVEPYQSLLAKLTSKSNELELLNKSLIDAKIKIEKEYDNNERLINFLPDGILIVEDGKIVYSNKRFMDMFNLPNTDKILNKNIFSIVVSSYHSILSSRINALDKTTLLTPVIYEIEVNNKKIFAEVCSLYTNNKSKEQLIMAIRDISDKKSAEDMKLKLMEIERSEELKNEFFINISHELKTPINVIYSALQLQSIYNGDGESIEKYNELMKKNCLRLIRLSDNMLDITKIQSGFLKPNLRVENIVPIIENVCVSVIKYLNFKNLSLTFDTEYEDLYSKIDKTFLERILLNLLSNAVKYGKESGNIFVNVYTEGLDTIAISVKDDGIGMQLEAQQKVFLRLQKLDNSLSRNTEGSGVGLFLVKSLTEIQQGTINFWSKFNEGTEFIIRFSRVHGYEEVCATIEEDQDTPLKDTMEKVAIEFSDIYN